MKHKKNKGEAGSAPIDPLNWWYDVERHCRGENNATLPTADHRTCDSVTAALWALNTLKKKGSWKISAEQQSALLAEGFVGALKAAAKYDSARGVPREKYLRRYAIYRIKSAYKREVGNGLATSKDTLKEIKAALTDRPYLLSPLAAAFSFDGLLESDDSQGGIQSPEGYLEAPAIFVKTPAGYSKSPLNPARLRAGEDREYRYVATLDPQDTQGRADRTGAEDVSDEELFLAIEQGIQQLPEAERRLIKNNRLAKAVGDKKSVKVIAEEEGTTPKRVRAALERITRTLRQDLKEQSSALLAEFYTGPLEDCVDKIGPTAGLSKDERSVYLLRVDQGERPEWIAREAGRPVDEINALMWSAVQKVGFPCARATPATVKAVA